jgi:hypothetical protein
MEPRPRPSGDTENQRHPRIPRDWPGSARRDIIKFAGGRRRRQRCSKSIYPNPSDGRFSIISSFTKPSDIKIYNSQMQLVYETAFADGRNNFELNELASGLYFCILQTKELKTVERIAIIQSKSQYTM